MPYFSIVIPTYNRADLLPRCLDSVLRQNFSDFEVLVVDNFSTDSTLEILEQYRIKDSRIRYKQEHNHGVIAHSRNVGIRMASGEYICFLDSDDWFSDDKLSLVYEACEKSSPDVVYGKYQIMSEGGAGRVIGKQLKKNDKYLELLSEGAIICNTTVTVRKELLFSIGLLSERPELRAAEDFDCWLNLAKARASFFYIDKILCYYWVGSNESHSERQVQQIINVYDKHLPNLSNKNQKKAESCRDYSIGILYQSLGDREKAMTYYKKALKHLPMNKIFVAFVRVIFVLFNIRG